MPRVKTEAKERAILDAAAKVFARKPFHGVLIDEIASDAGIGKGTIYRYFETKDDLYFATTLHILDRLAATLSEALAPEQSSTSRLERIAVEMKGQVRVVPVKQIDYIVASGPYAELHVADKRYVIRERMQTLEERLDPSRFFRIHRSAIVRLDLVETLLRNPGGDYAVQLKGGVKLKVSRSRFEALEQRMGVSK